MNVLRNMEKLSCKYCRSGKPKRITYPEYVFVA